jgi:hypothetical protein
MLSFSVTAGVRTIADRYKSLFKDSATSYASLCALLSLALYNCKGRPSKSGRLTDTNSARFSVPGEYRAHHAEAMLMCA